jgi:CO/xanthine dehydrogenase Mo-binding subunit
VTAVGASLARLEGAAKVAGTAAYAADFARPGMLSVAVARSLSAHARLVAVHTGEALRVRGVVAVVTGTDVASRLGERSLTGPAFQDQPILAADRVRYAGEPYAAVVATSRRASRLASDLVYAEYEDLEPILEVDRAVAGPPYVHDRLRPARAFRDLQHLAGRTDTNACYEFLLRRGTHDQAMAAAGTRVAAEYRTPPSHHVPIELPCCLAWVERDRLEMVSTTQTPSYVRQMLADVLDVPLNRVRVRVPYLGGGFGSKMYDKLEPLTAYLAWTLRRPVQFRPSREEAFLLSARHGTVVRISLGAAPDGGLTAAEADVLYDTGAYADIGPRIAAKSGMVATGPYRTPNLRIRSRCVYTNKPPAGAFRGFGVPQLVWAHECMLDELAHTAGLDPVEIRRINLLREGDVSAPGTPMHSADLVGCLERVAEALDWSHPLDRGEGRFARGRGVAVGMKAVLTPTVSGAVVQLNQDASATLLIGTVDMGQGSDTVMAQIVAEVLSLAPGRVHVVQTDTDVTPYDTISAGSRSTYHMGNAVRLASERVREQLLEIAAGELETRPEDLLMEDGAVRRRGDDVPRLAIPDLFLARFGARGTTLTGEVTFQTRWVPYDQETGQSPQVAEHWFPAAAGVELTVDRWTGRVRVDHLVVAADVGRAINPRLCRQQLQGAALMGMAHSLFDEMIFEDGQLLNGSLLQYQVPSIKDTPGRLTPIVLESPHRSGPFGAKGVGETGILAVAPAIGNAVFDAVGVRVRRLPITPQRLLEALSAEAAR